MKKLNFGFVLVVLFLFISNLIFAADDLTKIKKAIQEKGANWEAGESWVSQLSLEDFRKLCGALPVDFDTSIAPLIRLPIIDDLPEALDWRDNNGNWVTPVKNQHHPQSCGSCWDFAAVAHVESWWKIHNSNVDSMIDLSEQFILSCGNSGSCSGGNPTYVLEDIKNIGIPLETCFPYQANDRVPCSAVCPNWQDDAIKIPAWGFVTMADDDIENIKNALYHQPVLTVFDVYADFSSYSRGVYEHVWGDYVAGHAVLIIGWNDSEQSWICKNSWGKGWGKSGYFRIKWSNCGIGANVPIIWDELRDNVALVAAPEHIDFTMVVGDTATKNIAITNQGTDELHFYTIGCGSHYLFHPDTLYAWDDFSWWCGDREINGYDNARLEFLETPLLNLLNTSSPQLLWMGRWTIEEPETYQDWDGYDGCNVFISVDGGKSYEIAYPTSPPYNCQNLYSFSHPFHNWNLGNTVPGWGGSSGGWRQVEFDLSPYKSDSVLIRFAFASDQGVCSLFHPELIGFFVDEIVISDGGSILFEDHGNDPNSMKKRGLTRKSPDEWIKVSSEKYSLLPNETSNLNIFFDTKTLALGDYLGDVFISTNHSNQPLKDITFNLNLKLPEHDIAVGEFISKDHFPLFACISPCIKIINCGLNDESNIAVECIISNQMQTVFRDTTIIDVLPINESKEVYFNSFAGQDSIEKQTTVNLLNVSNDYYAFNNSMSSTLCCVNLVDDFEGLNDYWDLEEGWDILDMFGAHSGSKVAYVNNGEPPYLKNMDAKMIFSPGFDLHSTNEAKLTFWAKYYTEKNKDFCYVEASGDSLNWDILYSLTGISTQAWAQHEVELTDFIKPEFEKVWVRFHVVSDSDSVETKSLGVIIDDVEIFPQGLTVVENDSENSTNLKWELSQNYPNPFNPTTTIKYSLIKDSHVKLTIYNTLGQIVEVLVNGYQAKGSYNIKWEAHNQPSGIYLYKLEADGFSAARKMFLQK